MGERFCTEPEVQESNGTDLNRSTEDKHCSTIEYLHHHFYQVPESPIQILIQYI